MTTETKEKTVTSEDVTKLTGDLAKIGESLKGFTADVQAKMKAGEKVSQELDEKITKGFADMAEARSKLNEKLAELEARNNELTQQLSERKSGGREVEDTIGEAFVKSDQYKAAHAKGASFRGRVTVSYKSVTSSGGISIEALRVPEIISIPRRRATIRDLLTPGRTSSNAVQFVRQLTRSLAANAVLETATKPESDMTFELKTANVATIAHWLLASKQVLDDAPMLQSFIDGELRYGLLLEEEDQLLNGDGSGANIHGIIPQADDYEPEFAASNPQRLDTIRLALLQVALSEFDPTGIVLHPTAWARIELLKDAENRYLFTQPQNETVPRLWGLPVVATTAMDATEFLVGAFRLGAQIFDREDANVQLSTEDDQNFRKNMVTVLAEERLALAVYRPSAFVHGDFGDAS